MRNGLFAFGVLAALVLSGCLDDGEPVLRLPPKPATCGNGRCDIADEDCQICPEDCSCCNAASAVGSQGVTAAEAALGAADKKSATLGENASLVLVVGRAIYDGGTADTPDFTLVGEVTSSATTTAARCATSSLGRGAFTVEVSEAGDVWELVGIWSQRQVAFDLGCSPLPSVRYVRIVGQPGAQGMLDALEASACLAK